MRSACLVMLVACGGSRATPAEPSPAAVEAAALKELMQRPEEQQPCAGDRGEDLDFEPDEPEIVVTSKRDELEKLASDIEAAYGDLSAGVPDAATRLRDLRAQAEVVTGEPAR